MVFNESKFINLKYNSCRTSNSFMYHTVNNDIEIKKEHRDLGIIMSDGGDFGSHIDNISLKSHNKMMWVLRTFQTRDICPIMILYKSLIQPQLEYCPQIWSPYLKQDILKIEAIQRSFTSKLNGLQGLNYWQRLMKLNIMFLQRRDRYIICTSKKY